ncbi:hypothetical protein C8U37_10579 [Trichococcus patagoniensis]|uniref:Uncharacterized protein n=1 Tax=Trichococcus patagoniensis TaxID=382641 RepID=A0A2T5IMY8_9LACT|nr:hypothetical protein C8U37_10579 [Trichococcus patagoniensis]
MPTIRVFCVERNAFVLWLSDSSGLSDKFHNIHALIVRFFQIIGQVPQHSCSGCPILPGYRTSSTTFVLWLSDSSRLSDTFHNIHALLVRFFLVIGQAPQHSCSGCPILPGYRTSSVGKTRRSGSLSAYWLLFLYCPDSIVNKAKMWQYRSIFRLGKKGRK